MRLKIIFVLSLQCLLNVALCGTIPRSDPYLRSLVKRYGTTANAGNYSGCGEPLLLTPLIEAKKLGEARNAAKVDPALFMGRESYSGYLTVNKQYNSNLFFWYFPAPGRAAGETPLILWLQGGPGASSLYGLFNEIGPFRVNGSGQLEEMPHSWGTNHSLLFIDNPVGAGFSFTDHDSGYATNQTQIGSSLYFALQQFLTVFPELRPAPLFIAGESYAGKHIPSLGIQIHWHRKTDQAERPINLQGMAIGNGFVDPATLMRVSFLMREMGLIDDRRADMVRGMEEAAEKYLKEGETTMAFYTFMSALGVAFGSSGISNEYNVLSDKEGMDLRYVELLQQHQIRKALHVGNTTFDNISMKVYSKVSEDMMNSAKPWMEELLNHYRIMTYNGHLDAMVPYHASVHTYNSLVFEGAAEYATAPRHVWRYPNVGVVAGYYKSAGRFLEVMVRGAGHMVPEDKPAEALALISAFALDQPLDSPGPKPKEVNMLLKILFVLSLQCLIDKALCGTILRSDPYLYSLVKRYETAATAGDCAGCGDPLLLSPLIEANKLVEARNAAKVDSALFMGRESYSGYLTVNKQYNSNLFFWYFPAPGRAAGETPLILWLQGGPGASSLYGLFVEIGPFHVNGSGHLEERVHSWGTNHSLLFIDNPVGTGFSFADNDDDGYATNQTQIGSSLYFALQQFLTVFPELRPAPLFVAGESYAGKHIPSLGIQIHWHRKTDQAERPINLQGMSIGNGFIDPPRLMRHSFLLRELGLVDDATAAILRQIEETAGKYLQEGDTEMGLFTFLSGMGMSREVSGITNQYNFLSNTEGLANLRYVEFLQQHHIRKAIHVGNTTFDNLNKVVYMKLGLDMMNSAKPWLEELLNHYRIMTYSGHLDAMVPYHASVYSYKSLVFKGAAEYATAPRHVWRYPNMEVAGYYKSAGRFLEVMVRGAGHMVPVDKPAEALALISAFTLDQPLDSPGPKP
ncbi:uncharacterized protein LOC121737884 [Aricia agestis]|uniref:uncharacterized protein LOC121737884 n=1 Tax=Aricia agestis TaxID=91739 RepID=UPI001C207A8B|nr:uncharacterized protein LOC121737884 [Aricia agestis]